MIVRAGALFGAMTKRNRSRAFSGGEAVSNAVRVSLASSASAVTTQLANQAEAGGGGEVAGERRESVVKSIGEQLSFGGVLGFAAGYSIRKVGKAVLFLVGTEVVILQYMAYREWLTMDWRKMGRDIAPKLSKSSWEGLVEILVYKMPFSAAFSGGLFAGLRLSASK